jgi:hypothetical protein
MDEQLFWGPRGCLTSSDQDVTSPVLAELQLMPTEGSVRMRGPILYLFARKDMPKVNDHVTKAMPKAEVPLTSAWCHGGQSEVT